MAPETKPCRACGKPLVFLRTHKNTSMPVDAGTVSATADVFDPKVHTSHFATCPQADKFRKRRK